MSELSTVAIKDGHRGHFPEHHQHHHQPADAERADRISRLAGFDRIGAAGRNMQGLAPGSANAPPPGYFDANSQAQMGRERSTVGSASATGSVGGRTTWASGSDNFDPDRMSEDQDVETSSIGGMSDEAASLVGFGEGARTPARQNSTMNSPAIGKASAVPLHLRGQEGNASPMSGMSMASNSTPSTPGAEQQRMDSRNLDGMTYDEGVLDTADRTPPSTGQGPRAERTAEGAIAMHQRRLRGQGQGDTMEVDKEN